MPAMPSRLARRSAAVLPPLLLLLAGCATPETRLRQGLIEAGLSEPVAACMAGHMAERLSTAQLAQLRSLRNLRDRDASQTSYAQLMHDVRALRDPQILSVTTSAAVRCAFAT